MNNYSLLLPLAAVLAFTACTGQGGSTEKPTQETSAPTAEQPGELHDGSWTVCLYLCGSNLETKQGWATKTIEELKAADMPENISFVIETGGSAKWRNDTVPSAENRRYTIEGGQLTDLGTAGKGSMGEEETLADFLTFCETEYPAEHTAVILWDHGGGPLKGACFDETEKMDALTLTELDSAFKTGIEARNGRTYDIVGFDACLMSTIETAVILDDDAQLMIASQEIENGAGWDYAPMISAIGEQKSSEDIAKAVCDGYYAKCESKGKSATATLAVTDLTQAEKLEQALDLAMDESIGAETTRTGDLRRLKFFTRSAATFGGATDNEGVSNLVDLRSMAAENGGDYPDEAAWNQLVHVIDEAVLYHVGGSAVSGANGLSVWFPQVYDEMEFRDYQELSPLEGYCKVLNTLFMESMQGVTYSDPGSVNKDGNFSVTIAPETADSFYDIYMVNRRKDGGYCDNNIDIQDDWNNLTFAYSPELAVAITLNGMILDAEVISYNYGQTIFSCPITLNGEKMNLRICWFTNEDEEDGGHYELLGVWNGIDHVTGISDRMTVNLEAGNVIGARSLETDDVREKITLEGDIVIDDTPMKPGDYECWFVAIDLYGNEYRSSIASYQVTEDGRVI